MLTKVVNTENEYLDITELVEGVHYEKLCYVTNSTSGVTKLDKGYFTFFVKDKNANVIRAQLFDVKDFIESGFMAKFFINKPVKLNFLSQMYNGQWSLIIKEISLWEGDFDYQAFRGSVVCDATRLKSVAGKVVGENYLIPAEYSTVSLPTICAGRCGGYIKLMDSVLTELYNYKNLPSVDISCLLEAFFYTMDVYYDYLLKLNKFSIIPSSELFDLLKVLDSKIAKNPHRLEISEACRSIVGLVSPQHLYAHLICTSVKKYEEMFNLVYTNATLTKGSLVEVGGVALLRY